MGFSSYLGNGFKALKFDTDAIASVRDDSESRTYSLVLTTTIAVLLAFVGFASGLMGGNILLGIGMGAAFFALVFIALFFATGIVHFIARAFKGTATFMQYYAVLLTVSFALGVVSIPATILGLIPFIGTLISIAFAIFSAFVTVIAIRETYSLSSAKAFLVWVIPVLVIILLAALAAVMYFGVLPSAHPESCYTNGGGLSCTEFDVKGSTGIQMTFQNTAGVDYDAVNVTVIPLADSKCIDSAGASDNWNGAIPDGGSHTFSIPCTLPPGTSFSGKISIVYVAHYQIPAVQSETKTATGVISAKVENY